MIVLIQFGHLKAGDTASLLINSRPDTDQHLHSFAQCVHQLLQLLTVQFGAVQVTCSCLFLEIFFLRSAVFLLIVKRAIRVVRLNQNINNCEQQNPNNEQQDAQTLHRVNGTAQSDDKQLWVCHYELFLPTGWIRVL